MIISPPQLVGSATVAEFLGVSRWWLRQRLANGDDIPGYLGKIAGRHTWNLHALVASTFDSEASLEAVINRLTDPTPADPLDTVLCGAPGCDHPAESIGLCPVHFRRLLTAWRHAGRSQLVTVQLVAMCRWVVERNAHLVLDAGFDPWANVCMTPGCGKSTNVHGPNAWHGPLCGDCTARFWGYSRHRPRPRHWKAA